MAGRVMGLMVGRGWRRTREESPARFAAREKSSTVRMIVDQRQPGSDHVARYRPAMHPGEQNNAVQQGVVVDVGVAAQLPLFLSFFTVFLVAITIHKNRGALSWFHCLDMIK